MTYAETLAALFARRARPRGSDLGSMRALLAALGGPHERLRAVLVAGTNGKGSTSYLLAESLRRQGHRVGLYTSPHLRRFTERIRVDGREVTATATCALYAQVAAAAATVAAPLGFFELTTAMALLAFVAARVDWAVLEVGLGGRLDATNVVPRQLSVVTPIAMDHQAYLGHSLEAIATEKADIIAAARPLVVAPQPAAAALVLRRVAAARGAAWHPAAPLRALPPGLPPYQRANFGAARRAARLLGCSRAACAAAAAAFDWPGRYQWLPRRPRTLLDGAHNPHGLRALLRALAADPRRGRGRLRVVFSARQDKNVPAMLAALAAAGGDVFICPLAGERGRSAAAWAQVAGGRPVLGSVAAALAAAEAACGGDDVLLVTGSLRLVAEAQAHLLGGPGDPPWEG